MDVSVSGVRFQRFYSGSGVRFQRFSSSGYLYASTKELYEKQRCIGFYLRDEAVLFDDGIPRLWEETDEVSSAYSQSFEDFYDLELSDLTTEETSVVIEWALST